MSKTQDLAITYFDRTRRRTLPTSPQARQLIDLVGGPDIFTELMHAMETFNESESRIQSFSRIWTDEKKKDVIIRNLMTNEYFFESFLKAKPIRNNTEGNNILCIAYAMEKFTMQHRPGKKRKIDIQQIL